jgi:hypothetical protein
VHRGSFHVGVAHGLGIRQLVHFQSNRDLPGIALSRRYQMNGSAPLESEQSGEFQYGSYFSQVEIINQFLLEVELSIRSAIAAADPSNISKHSAKLVAAERESEDRRIAESECERQRLEQEASLAAQQSASASKSSSCVIS